MFGRESFRDFLERIGDENSERLERIGDENSERLERINEENTVRWERALEETREFNRELLLRNEKVYTRVIAQLEKNTAETQANTEGLLKALDRFFGKPGGDPA